MATFSLSQPDAPWTGTEKLLFRFFAVYFLIQVIPLDPSFYRELLTTDFSQRSLFALSRYTPRFFAGPDTFANWAVVAVLALVGAAVWTYLERTRNLRPDYDRLYYFLRVLVRYRLALGVIAFGLLKLFPLQAPLPSLSNLNTPYGDFSAWKIFSLSLGIVPNYQSFLGGVELLGGLLLLNRRTTVIGTLLILPFTGNVFFSNLAYEGGEYVYSFYLISLALFLFAYDAVRLFSLVSLERPTAPARFRPDWSAARLRTVRLVLKTFFIGLFVVGYGARTYAAYRQGPVQFPRQPGLAGAAGLYDVAKFRWNGQPLPYSKTDSVRWQNVVFETWNTLSVQSNRPVVPDLGNTEELADRDEDRAYEYQGTRGRHYYRYEIDAPTQTLRLTNRNPHHADDALTLRYERPTDSTLVLTGLTPRRDSLRVVLNRLPKKYLVYEAQKSGRQRGLKL
jgi:hypothetical protein